LLLLDLTTLQEIMLRASTCELAAFLFFFLSLDLGGSSDGSAPQGQDSSRKYIEVGANELAMHTQRTAHHQSRDRMSKDRVSRSRKVHGGSRNMMRAENSETRPHGEWFGESSELEEQEAGERKHIRKHEIGGLQLEEKDSRVVHGLGHGAESYFQEPVTAMFPLIKAYMSRPSDRDMWPREVEDEGPGDDFGSRPADPVDSPGDALLQVNSTEEIIVPDRLSALMAMRAACDECKNCSRADYNQPWDRNQGRDDGTYCVCLPWSEWELKTPADGQYPGQNAECRDECVDLPGSSCASLNCSCDLNLYWADV